MGDLEKQYGTSVLRQALCIISNPSVNSNWSYSPETLNLGRNWQYFVPYDLDIWWMTSENNRAPPLCYIKLCASFQIHRWTHTWVTVWKRSIRVKIGDFFCPAWPWTLMNYLQNHRAPLLCYIKLCASLQSHGRIQTGVTVRKRSIRVKVGNFLSRVTLTFEE